MKIGFLHITDLHILNESGNNELMIDRMLNVIEEHESVEYIVIIISGDIAFSGKQSEYKVAEKLFDDIVYKCLEVKNIKDVELFIVPGNHDVANFNELKISEIAKAKENHDFSSLLLNERKRLKDYLSFSKKFSRFHEEDNFTYYNDRVVFDGFSIDVHLINSAIFSTDEEDKGHHYFSTSDLARLEKYTKSKANLKILITHHPIEWFMDISKIELENIISNNIDIVFWGHEHNPNQSTRQLNDNSMLLISQGGKFSNRGDWKDSEFNFVMFNRENDEVELIEYKHIDSSYQRVKESLPVKINDFKPTNVSSDFFIDNKLHKRYDIRDIFVFPNLNREIGDTYKSSYTDRIHW